ncbi:response regulator receiver domain-containing protein [Chitinophaga dinghuensis]|uniref:Response regulator receiver domain-containing protein n=1 Tax=Chitinophaga dinghuensis TaxID=1539050 RepID=A0A327VWV1_9BACT|nr:response regulator [Chitinophaga dinghuensis]RAJ79942.1 response regulator receiver domain-containing protein [Chitinophaga dinghuensis]
MKKKVLIIDDSLPIRFLLEAIFSKNYHVVSAQDGLVAMSWLAKGHTPDLIITDLQMPNIDGHELVQFLAASNLYRDIPVVVLSACNDADTIAAVNQHHNVQAFFSKPFDPVLLSTSVADILNGHLVAAS